MKSFAFALAAVASVAWSGTALAQCKSCARPGSPVGSRTVVAQPTYQLAPVTIASPTAPCCKVGTAVAGPAAMAVHQHGVVVNPTSTAAPVAADEPAKEVKLTGTLVCGKCNLKATAKCSNVLQVKDGDKLVNYFLDDKGNGEPYHEGVCGGDKVEGVTVTGVVTEKDGKKSIKPSKVTTK
ncbi:MAG: hypothetical protein K8U57_04665 [Planctomycetes bacterium]|nr:hypothetical protein [Planctomycetota bacterium]